MEKSTIENKQFVIDLPVRSTFKERNQLKQRIIKANGIISYIVNKNVDYVIRDNNDETVTYKVQRALHFKIPVVTLQFLEDCLEKNKLLDPKKYYPEALKIKVKSDFNDGKIQIPQAETDAKQSRTASFRFHNIKVFKYKSEEGPPFHCHEHAVARVALLKGRKKKDKIPFCLLEIHVSKANIDDGIPKYCIFVHNGILTSTDIENESKLCRYFDDITNALMAYDHLYRMHTSPPNSMLPSKNLIQNKVGSDRFLPDEWLYGTQTVLPKVTLLINHIWKEANSEIQEYLSVDLKSLSCEQIETSKMLLWKILNNFQEGEENISELWKEFYKILPHKDEKELTSIREIKEKFIQCQILIDLLSATESIEKSQDHNLTLYKALHCSIEPLDSGNEEYKQVISQFGINGNFIVDNIYKIHHFEDFSEYDNSKGNERLLLHPTRVQDLIGLLPRGLSLFDECYIRVADDLTHRATDSSEIYFLDKLEACLKYTPQSKSCGTRIVLINQVALGECKQVHLLDDIQPSEDCDSYHCIRRELNIFSEYDDDEFVIFNNMYQKQKFLLEFHLKDDEVKPLDTPNLFDQSLSRRNIPSAMDNADEDYIKKSIVSNIDISELLKSHKSVKNLKATLKEKGSNSELPLKSVHVRATLIDLAAEVTVIQEFANTGSRTIEGKYVFPLTEKAVVCGFEAFTEGRHFVGRIEGKEEAAKEYRQAVQTGQRAYLMEEDAPDVFSVNIGNISSGATVIVKITYVSELYLEGDLIKFSIPGSVYPLESQQQESSVVSATIQNTESFDSSVEIFLDMPFPIRQITSTTNKLKIKKTETKAVVTIDKNDKLTNGFHLLIGLTEIHTPRMWIEESDQGTSDACMLVFYPEFHIQLIDGNEIIIAIDLSNSMKDILTDAQTVALLCLHFLPENCKFNVIKFGTVFEELFPISFLKSMNAIQDAQQFVLNSVAQSGNSNIRHLLHSYNLLPPKPNIIRNIFIISDGHFNCPHELFTSAHKNQHHTRIFTFGIGSGANNHLLGGLAISGGGGFVSIDKKEKMKWGSKVKYQIDKTCEPVLTDVDVEWKTYEYNELQPLQAPSVITTLFNGSRLVVYGLISHCNLAALKAKVKGHELNSIVYASELSKTKGSTLHCLATKALVDDWCYGNLHLNRTKHELLKRQLKPSIINLSKTFSIVTPMTSFVGVEDKDVASSMVTCTVSDILNKTNVDFLPYLFYEDDKTFKKPNLTMNEPLKNNELINRTEMIKIQTSNREISKMRCRVRRTGLVSSMNSNLPVNKDNQILDVQSPHRSADMFSCRSSNPEAVKDYKIHTQATVRFKQSNEDEKFKSSEEWREIKPRRHCLPLNTPVYAPGTKECDSDNMFEFNSAPSNSSEPLQSNAFGFIPSSTSGPVLQSNPFGMIQMNTSEQVQNNTIGSTGGFLFGSSQCKKSAPGQNLQEGFGGYSSIGYVKPVFGASSTFQGGFDVCPPHASHAPTFAGPSFFTVEETKTEKINSPFCQQQQMKSEESAGFILACFTGDNLNDTEDLRSRDAADDVNDTDESTSFYGCGIIDTDNSNDAGDSRDADNLKDDDGDDHLLIMYESSESTVAKSCMQKISMKKTRNMYFPDVNIKKKKKKKSVMDTDTETFENKLRFLSPKGEEMTFENGSLSLGSGLPFVNALLKAYPEKWWLYKDVTLHALRRYELMNSHDDSPQKQTSKELDSILECCNEIGGIDTTKIPKECEQLLAFFIEYLQSLGISSLAKPIQEATFSLLASLVAIIVICKEIIPDALPFNLQDPLILETQAKTAIETLCEEYHETIQFAFYSLLTYVKWINNRYPLVYHTLELGNSWEAALKTLLSKYVLTLKE